MSDNLNGQESKAIISGSGIDFNAMNTFKEVMGKVNQVDTKHVFRVLADVARSGSAEPSREVIISESERRTLDNMSGWQTPKVWDDFKLPRSIRLAKKPKLKVSLVTGDESLTEPNIQYTEDLTSEVTTELVEGEEFPRTKKIEQPQANAAVDGNPAPTGEATTETAEAPTGEAPTGEAPTGEAPTGEAPTGDATTGEAPTGEAPTGEAPTGEAPTEGSGAAEGKPAGQARGARTAEGSGANFSKLIQNESDISDVDSLKTVLNKIIDAPEFNNLPAPIFKAFKEAAAHQIDRIDGIMGQGGLYDLKIAEFEANNLAKNIEIRRKEWERNLVNLKRYGVPLAIGLGIVLTSGAIGGIAVSGAQFAWGSALGYGAAAGVATLVGGGIIYGVSRGVGYTSESAVQVAQMNADIAKLRAEAQRSYLGIHNLRAERATMPIQAVEDIAKLAAEASWAKNGKKSGLKKEEYINRFMDSAGMSSIAELRKSMSQLALNPSVKITNASQK